MKNLKYIIILLFQHLLISGYSQNILKLDSLKEEYINAGHDSVKIKKGIEIGNIYQTTNSDSALFYYNNSQQLSEKHISLSKVGKEYSKTNYLQFAAFCLRNSGLVYYSQGRYDKAMDLFQKALTDFEISNNKKYISLCYQNFGLIYINQGAYDKAYSNFQKALTIAEQINDKFILSQCYTNLGNTYNYQGQYEKAIECHIKSLKLKEEMGDKTGMSNSLGNIGLVFMYQNSNDKAIEYFEKALKLKKEVGDKKGMSTCLMNIGLVYRNNENYDLAINYFEQSLKVCQELGDNKGMSRNYNNIGQDNMNKGNYGKAKEYYQKSLEIKEKLGDRNGIAAVWVNLSELNYLLADSVSLSQEEKNNYYSGSVNFGLKAINLAKEINAVPLINDAALKLKQAYKKIGKTNDALEYAEIFINTRDSMFREEKTKALAEMETKYQSEKKQLEIEKLEKQTALDRETIARKETESRMLLKEKELDKETIARKSVEKDILLKEKELDRETIARKEAETEKLEKQKALDNETIARKNAETRKQRIIIFAFILGFVIILFFSIVIYRLFLQKKRANVILAQQKEEISSQRDEIESQRDLVVEQKEQIEEIHKGITDSINYAKRIQEAILPMSENSRSVLGEHFVLFKPKDIVSGDFYFITKVNNMLVIAVADCTGHGVPGAFMSMLGISFLNEIVQKQEIHKASQILNFLRRDIVNALQQKGVQGEQKDGMDISLIAINRDTNECQWAGANNPLYIVKKSKNIKPKEENPELSDFRLSDFQLYELKGDKMPIAIYPEMKDFTNHEFKVNKDDCVYLFTDGYADQFGGPKGKKFMYSRFKNMLLNVYMLPMIKQKEILEKTIESWKHDYNKEYEQIDDVTVLGIRV